MKILKEGWRKKGVVKNGKSGERKRKKKRNSRVKTFNVMLMNPILCVCVFKKKKTLGKVTL